MNINNTLRINAESEIFNSRNQWLSDISKNKMMTCYALICNEESIIKTLNLCHNSKDNLIKNHNVSIENYRVAIGTGISTHKIVEKSAEFLNFIFIPVFYKYDYGNVLQIGQGADYILHEKEDVFTLESKGVNSKYNCPKKISEGIDQVKKSFRILEDLNITFGLVGESCFYENIQYLIKINNDHLDNNEELNMDEMRNKIEEKSSLITKARTLESLNKEKESKKAYYEAALKEKDIATSYEKQKSRKARIHWVSAISCAFKSDHFMKMFDWINHLETNYELNKEILDFFGRIRGKKHILIEMYFIFLKIRELGKYLEDEWINLYNPIYNKKISNLLQQYIDNNYLIRDNKNFLQVNSNIRRKFEIEEEMYREILSREFSSIFIKEINRIVKKYGKLSSKEIEKIENEKLNATSFQYGRHI
ncbi:MAG: hypothetical protein P8Y70_11880 [Candidatus Lokiarchaeota archaeon]